MLIADKDLPAFSVSVAAFLFSLLGLYNNFRFASKGNKAKVLTDLFTESRSLEVITTRRKLGEEYAKGKFVVFEPYKQYAFFLNHIGLLLHHGYVDVEDIYQFIGGSVIIAWQALGPAIIELRAKPDQSSYYQFHFQYLAAQLLEYKKTGDEEIELLIAESADKIRVYSEHL